MMFDYYGFDNVSFLAVTVLGDDWCSFLCSSSLTLGYSTVTLRDLQSGTLIVRYKWGKIK
ncbi:uncharacterized protein PHALS_05722 [Plasmopara halstedii]|uniref:Uncharacterized protein n=1 Tax=Plasmopara halstedii TaxID=4781 RepID=A0A0P1B1F3_PLAHL|nr:uncharacterized protein PHALS_05722 [Plasmopara halstedii]CEG48254.1 hypothetical protein PHALS_05722 [Plasmopara halstedii]|eukprot:XP_024584623.1 hypothetical protein PHALS_05722 [Plasmopara halstedii]